MRNIGIASSISMMRGLGFSSIWIFSALYLRNILGFSVFQVGVIITVGTGIAAVIQKFAGSLSDRIGHKKMVTASLFASTVLFLILVISPTVRMSQLYFTIIFVSMTVSNSAQMPATYSIVSGSSEIKTKGFSYLRVGSNIGWGIGPAIGGFAVYASSGFYYLFIFGLLSSFVALILTFFLQNVEYRESASLSMRTENILLIYLSLVTMLLFMVQAQETITLPNYANIIRGMNYLQLGLIYLVNGILVIATQGFVYKAIRKIGNYSSFVIGSLLYSAGFFSFALVSSFYGMIVSMAILTIGEDFAFPSSSAMVSLISKPENIGRNMGIYSAFLSLGRATGPIVGGVALSLTSVPVEIWAMATASGFISTILFVATFRKVSVIQEKGIPET